MRCLPALPVLLFSAAAAAADGPSVTGAWSRATADAAMPAAVFATIHGGGTADALLGVATPVAGQAMLHAMDMTGGMMRMRMMPALPVPAGATVTLGPGGDHVMLTALRHGLSRGETFPATFRFAHGAPVTVVVRVAGPGATAAP